VRGIELYTIKDVRSWLASISRRGRAPLCCAALQGGCCRRATQGREGVGARVRERAPPCLAIGEGGCRRSGLGGRHHDGSHQGREGGCHHSFQHG
jgi:hypothetical protein